MRQRSRIAGLLVSIMLLLLLLNGCTIPESLKLKGVNLHNIFRRGEDAAESSPTPEPTPTPMVRLAGAGGVVQDLLLAVRDGDSITVRRLCGDEIPGYRGLSASSGMLRELYDTVYSHLSFRIGAVSESARGASVGVELTTLDMRAVLNAWGEKLAAASGGEEDRPARFSALLTACLAEAESTVTKKVTISLRKTDGEWSVAVNSDLCNALTGGLMTALQDFDAPYRDGQESLLEDTDSDARTYLLSNDYGAFTVTAIRPNAAGGYTLEVEAVNKTGGAAVFSLRGCVIDGFVLDPGFTVELSAGETRNVQICWDRSELAACGIRTVHTITFTLDLFERHAWPVYPLWSVDCAVRPNGWANAEGGRLTAENETVLLDNGTAYFSVLSAVSDGCWGCTCQVYLENETDKELWFSLGDTTVNAVPIDPGWSQMLPPHTRAVKTIRFSAGTFFANDISWVDKISFRLFVSSLDDLDLEDSGYSAGGWYTLSGLE